MPGETQDSGETTLPQKPGDTTIRVTDVFAPAIEIYKPAADKDARTAVIICPGGGYNVLAWNKEGTEVAEWFNSIGVTGVVLKYRVPGRKGLPKYAAALQDAQRALGMVRHRASELGIGPDRIGILGFSAGGHLAAALSNNFESRSYEPIDAADQVSCRPDFSLLIYPAYLVKDKTTELSPELTITPKTPRTFLMMTEDDGLGIEGVFAYYRALKESKVDAELHLFAKGGHGYGLRAPKQLAVSSWPECAERFLRATGMAH